MFTVSLYCGDSLMPGQISQPKSLCLLRLSALGDVCHAVALVQHIQRSFPDIKITWVIGKVEANLLADLPNVEFVIFDKRAGISGYTDLRDKMKGRKFDVLLHMQVALRASIASLCIPAKVKIGFDKKRAIEGQWLFTNQKVTAQQEPHVLEGFMAFAERLGIPTLNEALSSSVSGPSGLSIQPLWTMPIADDDISSTAKLVNSNKAIALLCPAASKPERNWHSEGYAKAADYLSSLGYYVVLSGSPTPVEVELAQQIEDKSQSTLLNLVGKTSLKQVLALIKSADMVLAPDTGAVHMAVAVGTPAIGLYAHSNPKRTGPYLYQQYVVNYYEASILQQQGKSSSELKWGIRAKGDNLMQQITIEDVIEKINAVRMHEYQIK